MGAGGGESSSRFPRNRLFYYQKQLKRRFRGNLDKDPLPPQAINQKIIPRFRYISKLLWSRTILLHNHVPCYAMCHKPAQTAPKLRILHLLARFKLPQLALLGLGFTEFKVTDLQTYFCRTSDYIHGNSSDLVAYINKDQHTAATPFKHMISHNQ